MNKNYYAIIPATVRYNKKLSANVKLLYAEITALTNEKGYCWATNKYFADFFEVDARTIQRWLKTLADEKYITITITRNPQTQAVEARTITLSDVVPPPDRNVVTPRDKNVVTPPDRNVAYNNINNNNINLNHLSSKEGHEDSAKNKAIFQYALELAKHHGAYNHGAYAKTCLQDWQRLGATTLEEVQAISPIIPNKDEIDENGFTNEMKALAMQWI